MSLWQTYGGGSAPPQGILPWGRLHLHQMLRTLAGRPETDEALTPELIDQLLTLAQAHWYGAIAAIVPEALYGPPHRLESRDGGYTYEFGHDEYGRPIDPMGHVQLMRGSAGGPVIRPGVPWSPGGFITEQGRLRWTDGRPHRFAEGLWGRWVTPPGPIDESHEPTLVPIDARMLLVYRALVLWAKRGKGVTDPAHWESEEMRLWAGAPEAGDYGLIGRLRTQYDLAGAAHLEGDETLRWWDFIDTGAGYIRHG